MLGGFDICISAVNINAIGINGGGINIIGINIRGINGVNGVCDVSWLCIIDGRFWGVCADGRGNRRVGGVCGIGIDGIGEKIRGGGGAFVICFRRLVRR